LIEYRVGAFELLLPLDHALPRFQGAHPLYDTSLGRLAALVHRKYPQSSIVDVGANVGDTAALIRSSCPAPLLCIEGSARFFALLQINAQRLGERVILEHAMVGGEEGTTGATLRERAGTATLVRSTSKTTWLVALDQILERHPELPAPKLVKIDTDGQDCPIVEGSMTLWDRVRPVLFFEYDPAFHEDWSPLPMWNGLREAGYERVLVLENTGPYAHSLDLGDRAGLEDLHLAFSGHGGGRYADVAVFRGEDADLAGEFRLGELRAAMALRQHPWPRWVGTELLG